MTPFGLLLLLLLLYMTPFRLLLLYMMWFRLLLLLLLFPSLSRESALLQPEQRFGYKLDVFGFDSQQGQGIPLLSEIPY
jgi:hypothetical protein